MYHDNSTEIAWAKIQSDSTDIAERLHFGPEVHEQWNDHKKIAEFIRKNYNQRTDYDPGPGKTSWKLDFSEYGWDHMFDFTINEETGEVHLGEWLTKDGGEKWLDAFDVFYPD